MEGNDQLSELELQAQKAELLTGAYPNLLEREGELKIQVVNTDKVAIVEKDSPITSGRFYGCTALFIFDGEKTLLAHMTASEKLPVHGFQSQPGRPIERAYVAERQDQLLKWAKESGLDLSKSRYLIISESGNAYREEKDVPQKYSIEDTEEAWQALKAKLAEHGVTEGALLRTPLSNFNVHYDPKADGVFLTGIPHRYDENGHLRNEAQAKPETIFVSKKGEIPANREIVYPKIPDRTSGEAGSFEPKPFTWE